MTLSSFFTTFFTTQRTLPGSEVPGNVATSDAADERGTTDSICEDESCNLLGLDRLPLELIDTIVSLLPGDARVRLAAVCKQLQEYIMVDLAPHNHSVLRVTKDSGCSIDIRISGLRVAAALAQGQLTELHVEGCKRIDKTVVSKIAFENPLIKRIHAFNIFNSWTPDEARAVLEACPHLEEFEAEVMSPELHSPALDRLLRLPPPAAPGPAPPRLPPVPPLQLRLAVEPAATTPASPQAREAGSAGAGAAGDKEECAGGGGEAAGRGEQRGALRVAGLTVRHLGTEQDVCSSARYLTETLLHRDSLRCLRLHHCGFKDVGVQVLVEGLLVAAGRAARLEELDLSFNSLTAEGARHVAAAVRAGAAHPHGPSNLRTLGLACNHIGEEGARHLAVVLMDNAAGALRDLRLGCNALGDAGLCLVARAVAENTSLQRLELRGNTIGPKGAAALANMLAHNTALLHLDLGCNVLRDEGGRQLSDGLWDNSSLRQLVVDRNDIEDEAAREFEEALNPEENECVVSYLDLRSNRMSPKIAERLQMDSRIDTAWQLQAPPKLDSPKKSHKGSK